MCSIISFLFTGVLYLYDQNIKDSMSAPIHFYVLNKLPIIIYCVEYRARVLVYYRNTRIILINLKHILRVLDDLCSNFKNDKLFLYLQQNKICIIPIMFDSVFIESYDFFLCGVRLRCYLKELSFFQRDQFLLEHLWFGFNLNAMNYKSIRYFLN